MPGQMVSLYGNNISIILYTILWYKCIFYLLESFYIPLHEGVVSAERSDFSNNKINISEVILMVRLDLESSIAITQAAFGKSRELSAAPLTVAILDSAGKLISLQRQDGSSMLRPDIAIGKAWGAVAMGKSSRELGRDALERPAFISSLTTLAQGHLVPVAGGVLVRNSDNEVVGAVGISGDLSDVDELCAITGIQAAGLIADAGTV